MDSLTSQSTARDYSAGNDRSIVDMIERATDEQSYCSCGQHTTAVWRDGIVWLECSSRLEPAKGRFARLVRTLSSAAHVHESIVDLPAEDVRPAA
jgi:hypothetical protein